MCEGYLQRPSRSPSVSNTALRNEKKLKKRNGAHLLPVLKSKGGAVSQSVAREQQNILREMCNLLLDIVIRARIWRSHPMRTAAARAAEQRLGGLELAHFLQ